VFREILDRRAISLTDTLSARRNEIRRLLATTV
jgi:hypothetical protein